MATDAHFNYNSTMSQFPQPARPFNSADTFTCSRMNENNSSRHFPEECDHNIPEYSGRAPEGGETIEVNDDLHRILREFAEDYNGKGREILNKFLSKLDNNVKSDNYGIFRKMLEEFGGQVPDLIEKLRTKMNSEVVNHPDDVMQRGVNSGSNSGDEQPEIKLERFKVKTVIHEGGVVKVVKN